MPNKVRSAGHHAKQSEKDGDSDDDDDSGEYDYNSDDANNVEACTIRNNVGNARFQF